MKTNPLETGCWLVLSAVEHQHHRMTRHIMEVWERYDLLFMLCTSTTNNSTPHRQRGLMGDKRTSYWCVNQAGVHPLARASPQSTAMTSAENSDYSHFASKVDRLAISETSAKQPTVSSNGNMLYVSRQSRDIIIGNACTNIWTYSVSG